MHYRVHTLIQYCQPANSYNSHILPAVTELGHSIIFQYKTSYNDYNNYASFICFYCNAYLPCTVE